MIDPSDADYAETVLVRRGTARMAPRFTTTADWIAATYGVRPLNLYLDRIPPDDRPRLTVIFEHAAATAPFLDADGFNYDAARQDAIAAFFTATNPAAAVGKKLLVVYADFASVARIDVNWRVRESCRQRLDRQAAQDGYWRFLIEFDSAVLFAFTEQQACELKPRVDEIEVVQLYRRCIAEADEFGYFTAQPPVVEIDSKEVFDRDYLGNDFFYAKRA